jgi:hypothetical protein
MTTDAAPSKSRNRNRLTITLLHFLHGEAEGPLAIVAFVISFLVALLICAVTGNHL